MSIYHFQEGTARVNSDAAGSVVTPALLKSVSGAVKQAKVSGKNLMCQFHFGLTNKTSCPLSCPQCSLW